jgi:hypothetical protein
VGLFCNHCFVCKGGENNPHLQIFCVLFLTEMSKILLRIFQFADSQGLSIRELERASGITQGVISKAIRNNGEIGSDKLENITQTYENFPLS